MALVAAACGRVGFDARTTPGDGAPGDAADARSIDAPAPITHVKVFVTQATATTFAAAADGAGNAVLIHVGCTSAVAVNLTLTAPGWTFTRLATPGTTTLIGAAFGAIAPSTTMTQFALNNAGNCGNLQILGDEFAGVDPTGGTTTFDATSSIGGTTGACDRQVVTANAGDGVWAACTAGNLTAVAAPFDIGASIGATSWTAYALTSPPANTAVTPMFTSTGSFVIEAVTIKP